MTDHKNIHEAFLAAQPNFSKPQKNAENTHFKNKYADLEAVLAAVRPALNDEGIIISQPVEVGEVHSVVKTIFRHASSDTAMETSVPLLMGRQDMQQFKSASTYARRIGLENLAGIAPSDDDDDADTTRRGNPMGAALNDAWKQGVEDSIPEGATPQERAKAYADAIVSDFKGKGERALKNRWEKHRKIVESMEGRFPSLHSEIIDAYENAMMATTNNYDTAAE